MKTIKSILLTGLLITVATVSFARGNNHIEKTPENSFEYFIDISKTFQKQLSAVVDEYLLLKNALVASEEKQAGQAARETLKSLDKVDMYQLKGDSHLKWMNLLKPIRANLNAIVRMQGLEMKRQHFRIVSENLTKAVKAFGLGSGMRIYVDFCPMTNNGKGGVWLSEDKNIKNPYYGIKMLTCGEVKEVIQ